MKKSTLYLKVNFLIFNKVWILKANSHPLVYKVEPSGNKFDNTLWEPSLKNLKGHKTTCIKCVYWNLSKPTLNLYGLYIDTLKANNTCKFKDLKLANQGQYVLIKRTVSLSFAE